MKLTCVGIGEVDVEVFREEARGLVTNGPQGADDVLVSGQWNAPVMWNPSSAS